MFYLEARSRSQHSTHELLCYRYNIWTACGVDNETCVPDMYYSKGVSRLTPHGASFKMANCWPYLCIWHFSHFWSLFFFWLSQNGRLVTLFVNMTFLGISESFSSFDLETLSLRSGYQRSGETYGVMFGWPWTKVKITTHQYMKFCVHAITFEQLEGSWWNLCGKKYDSNGVSRITPHEHH